MGTLSQVRELIAILSGGDQKLISLEYINEQSIATVMRIKAVEITRGR